MSQANKDELPFKVTRRINRKAKRAVANIDPAIDRANKAWNNSQYGLIQDRAYESEFGFDRYWGAKMRQQRNGQRTNNYPSPQQRSRSLEEIIEWWKSNNPYMNGTGLENQPLPTNIEGGNDECKSNVMGMGPTD
jgi:hypothetical protein